MPDMIMDVAYMAHGYCLLWKPWLVAMHVGSDLVIALSYFAIPVAIYIFVKRRKDLKLKGLAWMFVGFITLCGLTHIVNMVTLWYPIYETQAWIKLATAVISVATAVAIFPLIPKALAIPSLRQLEEVNENLELEVAAHRRTLSELEEARAALELKVDAQAAELVENEQRFRRYQELSLSGFLIAKSIRDTTGVIIDFEITFANPSALNIMERDDVVGHRLLDLTPGARENGLFELYRHVVENNEAISQEINLTDNGRDVWYTISAVCVDDGVAAAFESITEKKRREHQIRLLMREVNHRSKNLLAIVQAIAVQTARRGDPERFIDDLSRRLQALSGAQDLMLESRWSGVGLDELVRSQLAHLGEVVDERIDIEGPPMTVTPAAAQAIGMSIHELATNAIKYGALKTETGRIRIAWQVDGGTDPVFSLSWDETGGPAVEPPTRTGFGRMVFEQMASHALQGEVAIAYEPEGLHWQLTAPAGNVMPRAQDPAA